MQTHKTDRRKQPIMDGDFFDIYLTFILTRENCVTNSGEAVSWKSVKLPKYL